MKKQAFKSTPLLREFRRAVTDLAESLGYHPRMVSGRALIKQYGHSLDHQIRKEFGQYTVALDAAFPPEESPFQGYDNLQHNELQELIGDVIREGAHALNIEPHEMGWPAFRKYIGFVYGHNNVGLCDYAISLAGSFPTVRDALFPMKATPLTVNKVRTQQHARINRKLGREAVDQQFTLDQITAHCQKVFSKAYSFQTSSPRSPKRKASDHSLMLVLSDLHYGSDISRKETGLIDFGPIEEARRTAHIIREASHVMGSATEQTDIDVMIIGDIIQAQLHDPHDGAALAEQVERAMHVLIQSIVYLSNQFNNVRVHIVTGNHDRLTNVHKERAVNGKWNSILWIIGSALRFATEANCNNVTFHMPKTPYIGVNVFEQKVFATHGDTVLNLGNVHKAFPIASLDQQTTRLNSTVNGGYDIYLAGHVHQGVMVALDNGSKVFTNGSIVPPGPYAVSLGSFKSNCGQWLLSFTRGGQDISQRFISVSEAQDKDESLDEIISPWEEAQ